MLSNIVGRSHILQACKNTLKDAGSCRRYHLPSKMKCLLLNGYADSVDQLNTESEFKCPSVAELKPNEALVKINASSINPIDVEMTRGFAKGAVNFLRSAARVQELPLILGRDYSGEIVACGRNFTGYQTGDSVYGVRWILGQGTHAEYTVVKKYEVCPMPQNIDFIEAASLPAVAGTVWSTMITTGAVPRNGKKCKRILIPAGSGGVGTFATQLCQLYGHDVVTTCSADAIPLLHNLGIKHVIDYQSETYKEDLKSAGPFDVILGTLREEENHLPFFRSLLKPSISSKFISLQSPILADIDTHGLIIGPNLSIFKLAKDMGNQLVEGKGLYMWGFAGQNVNKVLTELKDFIADGKIRAVVDKTFKLEDALDAYKYVEEGHARGKTVITME